MKQTMTFQQLFRQNRAISLDSATTLSPSPSPLSSTTTRRKPVNKTGNNGESKNTICLRQTSCDLALEKLSLYKQDVQNPQKKTTDEASRKTYSWDIISKWTSNNNNKAPFHSNGGGDDTTIALQNSFLTATTENDEDDDSSLFSSTSKSYIDSDDDDDDDESTIGQSQDDNDEEKKCEEEDWLSYAPQQWRSPTLPRKQEDSTTSFYGSEDHLWYLSLHGM